MGLLDRVNAHEASPGRRGLLNKALSNDNTDTALDTDMGSVLVERLQRLHKNESSPFTALSLLKAFIPFHLGLILIQKEATIKIPAALGIEDTDDIDSALIMQNSDDASLLHILDNNELNSISLFAGQSVFLYTLFSDKQQKAVLLLSEGPNAAIDPDLLRYVLEQTKSAFYGSFIQVNPEQTTGTVLTDKKLATFAETSALNGFPLELFLFESLPESEQDPEKFQNTLESQGTALFLASKQYLLASNSIPDTEVFVHRLQKSYGILVTHSRHIKDQAELTDYLASLQ